jgi:hypothetical protein
MFYTVTFKLFTELSGSIARFFSNLITFKIFGSKVLFKNYCIMVHLYRFQRLKKENGGV